MEEEMIDAGFQAQGDAVPLASPTGKLLEVYASKTRAQALSLTVPTRRRCSSPRTRRASCLTGKSTGSRLITWIRR